MSDALLFLGPALAMCLVIASIHVYLGMHVLAREIIFVDLSLAQLAALGASLVLVLADDAHGATVQLAAFAFSALGAALFAFTGRLRHLISQEAIVGIVYAVAAALTVLVVSRSAHGAEHIKDVLVGSLLLTSWDQVLSTAAIYLGIGVAQVVLARRFIALSWDRDGSSRSLPHAGWWDFGFYLLFGIAISVAVQVAGVLLVFSFLIVPAVISRLFAEALWPRLYLGWAVAVLASVVGIAASWLWDLPTGATVVAAFGVVLVLAGAVRALRGR